MKDTENGGAPKTNGDDCGEKSATPYEIGDGAWSVRNSAKHARKEKTAGLQQKMEDTVGVLEKLSLLWLTWGGF